MSCAQQEKNQLEEEVIDRVQENTVPTNSTKITFNKINGKAILLGQSIKLLDDNLQEIEDISYLNEHVVDLIESSTSYFKINPGDDYCEEFKYIRIKINDFEGLVDGRKVYEIMDRKHNKEFVFESNSVSLKATKYFGIDVTDDDGLTFCSVNTPVFIKDTSANYGGIVTMIKNKNYQNKYPYLELKDDNMELDEVISLEKEANKYILCIKRIYQEGGAQLKIEIYKDDSNKYVAEIIENKTIEEQEL